MVRPAVFATAAAAIFLATSAARSQPVIGPELPVDLPNIGTTGGGQVRVASNGSGYLVASLRPGTYSGLFVTRVGLDGSLLDPTGIPLVTHGVDGTYGGHAVASDGDGYLVAWSAAAGDYSSVVAMRVGADGGTSAPIVVSPAPFEFGMPRIAFGGGTFLVVWADYRNAPPAGGPPDIYAARVTPPTVLDPSGVLVASLVQAQGVPPPLDVAYDGTNFVVGWQDCRGPRNCPPSVFAARVAPDGTVLDPGGLVVSTPPGSSPAVTGRGSGSLLAWGTSPGSIAATRMSTAGTLLDVPPLAVTTTASDYPDPALATSASGATVAVWTDTRPVTGTSTLWHIFGTRLASDGTILDPAGLLVSPVGESSQGPAIASDGLGYLAAWYGGQGTRIDAAGHVLDAPRSVSFAQQTTSRGLLSRTAERITSLRGRPRTSSRMATSSRTSSPRGSTPRARCSIQAGSPSPRPGSKDRPPQRRTARVTSSLGGRSTRGVSGGTNSSASEPPASGSTGRCSIPAASCSIPPAARAPLAAGPRRPPRTGRTPRSSGSPARPAAGRCRAAARRSRVW
jgi:hypothetical protein